MKSFLTAFAVFPLFLGLFSSNAFAANETSDDVPMARPANSKELKEKPERKTQTTSVTSDASTKKWNLRFSPLGLPIGYINVDVDFKIGDNWTLGPTVSYWRIDLNDTTYQGDKITLETSRFGARATWAKNGAFRSGLYFTPMIQYVSAKANAVSRSSGNTVNATTAAPLLTGLVGYQWFFGDTFNLNVGAGLAVGGGSKIEVNDGTSKTSYDTSRSSGLALDFMLGWAF